MKRRAIPSFAAGLFIVLFLTGPGAVPSSAQKSYKDLKFPPLHPLRVPKVDRVKLPNGMILYLLEDHALPLVNISARIGVGSVDEPPDKVGLAEIMGDVMRTGGTATWPGDKLDEYLESIAASIEIDIGETSGFADASFLSENTSDILPIFADVLMHPAFPQDKIELKKVEMRSFIARRNDDPNGIAFREFNKLIYGPDSPYARHPEYATVNAVTRDDLVAFHTKYFHPDNLMIGIWGDFNKEEMIQAVKKAFGDWSAQGGARSRPTPVHYEYKSTVNFIRKTDVNQSTILIGHIGGLRNNPDYFALQVMNYILGESFSSRLFRRVRKDQGLAYAVFGRYGADYDHPGVFLIGCMTKSGSTVQAIRSMLKELRGMLTEEVTEEELEVAKDSYLNSFVFNFDTKGEIIRRLMTYEYYGYPHDFLERTLEGVKKVTRADITRVARKYLHPDKVQILVVGNDKDFDEPLSVLGRVREIDITIPEPEEAVPQAGEAERKQGLAVLDRALEAMGGATRLNGVRSAHMVATGEMNTPQGAMTAAIATWADYESDRRRTELQLPMGKIAIILNGDRGWIVQPGGESNPLPASMKKEIMTDIWSDPLYLYRHYRDEGVQVQKLKSVQAGGRTYEVVRVQPTGAGALRWYFDAGTHLPVKVRYRRTGMGGGPTDHEERWSDWREVQGVKLPFKVEVVQGDQTSQVITYTSIKINPALDATLFQPESKPKDKN